MADELFRHIKAKLSPHALRIKSDFEVTCYTPEGIDAIKEALLAGQRAGTYLPPEDRKSEEKLEVKVPGGLEAWCRLRS